MSAHDFTKTIRDLPSIGNNTDMSVQNYHKLIKMKKLLADTQTKMFNRIKLFQKASQKLLKKRQHQIKLFQKLQNIKKDPIFSRTKPRPPTRESSQRPLSRQCQLRHYQSKQNLEPFPSQQRNSEFEDAESPRKVLAEKINEQRIKNAKQVKEDRQRNKIIIEQRKKRQMTRKLQSANLIRRERENAKLVKEQVKREKHEDFKRFMEEKYERERQEFIKLQVNLQQLQEKEKEALITWKKTIES